MDQNYRIEWIGTFKAPIREDIFTLRPCKSKSKKWAKRRANKCLKRILDSQLDVMKDNYELSAKAISSRFGY